MALALTPENGAYNVVEVNGARRHKEKKTRPSGSGWLAAAASKSAGKTRESSFPAQPLTGPGGLKRSAGAAPCAHGGKAATPGKTGSKLPFVIFSSLQRAPANVPGVPP